MVADDTQAAGAILAYLGCSCSAISQFTFPLSHTSSQIKQLIQLKKNKK